MLSNEYAGVLLKASLSETLYLALLGTLGAPADTGETIMAKEVAYGGYERTAVPSSIWNEPEGPAITNAEAIALPVWTSGAAQVVGWALCDQAEQGHLRHIGLTAALKIDEADPDPVIGPGLLRIVFA